MSDTDSASEPDVLSEPELSELELLLLLSDWLVCALSVQEVLPEVLDSELLLLPEPEVSELLELDTAGSAGMPPVTPGGAVALSSKAAAWLPLPLPSVLTCDSLTEPNAS